MADQDQKPFTGPSQHQLRRTKPYKARRQLQKLTRKLDSMSLTGSTRSDLPSQDTGQAASPVTMSASTTFHDQSKQNPRRYPTRNRKNKFPPIAGSAEVGQIQSSTKAERRKASRKKNNKIRKAKARKRNEMETTLQTAPTRNAATVRQIGAGAVDHLEELNNTHWSSSDVAKARVSEIAHGVRNVTTILGGEDKTEHDDEDIFMEL